MLYLKFCNSIDQRKKHCVAKVLLPIWEIFLHENNRNYNSYKFSTKLLLSSFCRFLQTKNKNHDFSKFGNEKYFCCLVIIAGRVALYFKAMPSSINFYKGIFLPVISVRIIVLWSNKRLQDPGSKLKPVWDFISRWSFTLV